MATVYDGIGPPPPAAPEPRRKRANRRESLTPTEHKSGQRRLYEMVEAAFHTLEEAMQEADYNGAIRAAIAILDRSGFGPKSAIDLTTTNVDLSELTTEQLAARAEAIHKALVVAGRLPADTSKLLDTRSVH